MNIVYVEHPILFSAIDRAMTRSSNNPPANVLIWPRSIPFIQTTRTMAKKRMNQNDLEHLLGHYRSERRRLNFQLGLVRNALKDLRKTKASMPKAPPKPNVIVLPDGTVKRRPGRPRKGEVVMKKPKRGPGRPPKRVRPTRALNAWDTMVINSIKTTGRLLPKEEILKQAISWAGANEPAMKKPEVEIFVTRTLQKLSGKKKMLGTHHTGLRRGHHYGLKEWFFNSSGKLRRQHFDRLVLDDKKK